MITPMSHDEHPHFKRPPPQGWSYGCYGIAAVELKKDEAKRMRRRRQRDDLDAERARDVDRRLDILLAEVAAGSELLYDGLSASFWMDSRWLSRLELISRVLRFLRRRSSSMACVPPRVSTWSAQDTHCAS